MFLKLVVSSVCFIPLFVNSSPYEELITKHSRASGLDPLLVKAIIIRESAFKANARSHKDARGLMQVIPSTAKMMGIDSNRLFEPEQSIIAGTRYLAFLQQRFDGNLIKMIAAYNAGHGAVEKYGGIPPYRETQNYVAFVTQKYRDLTGQGTQQYIPLPKNPPQRQNEIVVLSHWQQNQIPYSNTKTEPVRLRAVSSQQTALPNQANSSFVQTLSNGRYVQVF